MPLTDLILNKCLLISKCSTDSTNQYKVFWVLTVFKSGYVTRQQEEVAEFDLIVTYGKIVQKVTFIGHRVSLRPLLAIGVENAGANIKGKILAVLPDG